MLLSMLLSYIPSWILLKENKRGKTKKVQHTDVLAECCEWVVCVAGIYSRRNLKLDMRGVNLVI